MMGEKIEKQNAQKNCAMKRNLNLKIIKTVYKQLNLIIKQIS